MTMPPLPPPTSETTEQEAIAFRALVEKIVDARVRALVQPNALTPAKRLARPLTVDACLLDTVETNATWTMRGGMPGSRTHAILTDLRAADLYVTPEMLSNDARLALAAALADDDCGRHFPVEAWEPLRAAHRRAKAVQ
ncbi:hypothetical protein BH11MYX4_BH11MYX4_03770 [soil metagenome]